MNGGGWGLGYMLFKSLPLLWLGLGFGIELSCWCGDDVVSVVMKVALMLVGQTDDV